MRVLIVKISALGDVIHALPALDWIKGRHPEAEVDWLVEEGLASLIEGHPLLRRVQPLGLKRWRRKGIGAVLSGLRRTITRLRRQRYDVVLDLQGNCKSGLFTLLCGAPRRYGLCREGVREWPNLLATNRKVALGPDSHHVSDRSVAIAREAFPGDARPRLAGPLHLTASAEEAVAAQLQSLGYANEPLVVLQYGTTWVTKLWPLESWQQLVRCLVAEKGLRPLLIWGNDAEQQACRIIAESGKGQALIWPRGTLPELVALLARADLVVGGDTGPIHIAAAVGTATVSLFRVTDGTRNGPRGDNHRQLQAPLDCSPCLRKSCERDAECGHSIKADQVVAAIDSLLKRCVQQFA